MQGNEFEFRLSGMEILQSEIVELKTKMEGSINFQFDIKIEMKVNLEEKNIFIAPYVKIRIDNNPEYVGKLKIALAFTFTTFDLYFGDNSKENQLPKSIQDTLNNISISTLRGVMFNHFKGTFLHNAILPIVDSNKFNS